MIKTLLWDLDNTLLDFPAAERQAIQQAFAAFRLGLCPEDRVARYAALNDRYWKRLERGEITAGHARTLLSFKTEEGMRLGAKKAKEGASVRELEALAKRLNEEKEGPVKAPRKNQYYEEAQLAVGEYLNRKVKVAGTRKKGVLQIEFYGEEDLQNLLSELKLKEDE